MNISCLICSDIFNQSSEIFSTPCGHLFHHICLIQWIERSRTCPQCRQKTTEKTIRRIYFNFPNTEGVPDDVVSLQCKLDNLQFQLKLKEKDVKIAKENYSEMKAQNIGLKEEVKDLERELAAAKSAMYAHKEQINYFKERSKERERLADEVQHLKNQLKEVENVRLVISGTRDQVDEMLRQNRDPQSLTVLVTTLKKELVDTDRKKKQIHALLKEAQSDASYLRKEIVELNREIQKLRQEVQGYKDSEAERQYLKEKIKDLMYKKSESKLETTVSPETKSLQRIVQESPAPLPKTKYRLSMTEEEYKESPAVEEKVKAINNSDSPYLPIKSSSVGLPSFIDTTKSFTVQNKFSIFKSHIPSAENMKKPSLRPQGSYDGMGGYSNDETFPSPKTISSSSKLKRHRSLSSVKPAKLKKLAPMKKLDDYIQ